MLVDVDEEVGEGEVAVSVNIRAGAVVDEVGRRVEEKGEMIDVRSVVLIVVGRDDKESVVLGDDDSVIVLISSVLVSVVLVP